MNAAEQLVRQLHGLHHETSADVDPFDQNSRTTYVHPEVEFSLFGQSGTKEVGHGLEAYFAFVANCQAALCDSSDEILNVIGIDEECVFVRARAYRKAKATGEDIRYEWATLMRVEDGLITSVIDILDRDAQMFWGRAIGCAA